MHRELTAKFLKDELSKMIDELTGSSFDLKGLNDLKQLISMEN